MAGNGVWIIALFIFIMVNRIFGENFNSIQPGRCSSYTATPQRIEKIIETCQQEIKIAILKEALEILGETTKGFAQAAIKHRSKRDLFSEEEQRIAGCLLQCVYKKVKAVDENGFPTVEGLVNLYAEGVTEKGYFLATAQAVQQCLYVGQQLSSSLSPEKSKGQMCDLAYKVFDCISDQLANYCSSS